MARSSGGGTTKAPKNLVEIVRALVSTLELVGLRNGMRFRFCNMIRPQCHFAETMQRHLPAGELWHFPLRFVVVEQVYGSNIWF